MIGRAYYEIGDIDRAAGAHRRGSVREPSHAEAHYYLGLVRDERGDSKGATAAFLRCRQLDLDLAPPSWCSRASCSPSWSTRRWLLSIPILGRYVRDAGAYVSDVPGMELVADGVDPRALVLIDGVGTPESPPQSATRIFRVPTQHRAARRWNRSTGARDHLGVRARDHCHVPRNRLGAKRQKPAELASATLLE